MNARHSKKSVRWGTPPEWVEMACVALGGRPDLDPMSEAKFNEVVRADCFFTAKEDGINKSWQCKRMLINPPGGLVVLAWRKLVDAWCRGAVLRAVWFGFSVEQLCVLADEPLHPMDFSLLTCRKRIDFLTQRLKPGSRPSHGNYVVGIGMPAADFERAFAGRGRFNHGKHAVQLERR